MPPRMIRSHHTVSQGIVLIDENHVSLCPTVSNLRHGPVPAAELGGSGFAVAVFLAAGDY